MQDTVCKICLETLNAHETSDVVECLHCSNECHVSCFIESVKAENKFICSFCKRVVPFFKHCPESILPIYEGRYKVSGSRR